jgi:RNA polymerase sigma-70 factor (ECF subfamily)
LADQTTIELTRKAITGDQNAFEELCRKKTRSILFNALGMMGNMHDAEDAVQETFLDMFQGIGKLRNPEAIDLWLLRIVQNNCKRLLEKRQGRAEDVAIDEEDEIDFAEEDKEFIPEKYVENKELSNKLYDIVMNLPTKKREAIFMYHYNDMTYQQIADITGTTIQTVSTNIIRARKMIKQELSKIEQKDMQDTQTPGGAVPVSAFALSRVLKDQSLSRISDDAVLGAQEKYMAAFKTMNFETAGTAKAQAAAAGAVSKKAAALIIAAVLIVGAVSGVFIFGSDAPAAAFHTAPAEVSADGEITFEGGTGRDGHINPETAALAEHDIAVASVSWAVVDETTAAIVYEGQGGDPSETLRAMKEEEAIGRYLLKFVLVDENGYTITKKRVFEIE